MVFTKVRWFNIVAPLAALAATMFIVPSVHAASYSVDIKGGESSDQIIYDSIVFLHSASSTGFVRWTSDVPADVGSCFVSSSPTPPNSYWTGVSGLKQTGSISAHTAYLVECFVNGNLVASDSVSFAIYPPTQSQLGFLRIKVTDPGGFQLQNAGSTGVKIASLQVENVSNEPIDVRALTVQLQSTIGAPQNQVSSMQLYAGGNLLARSDIVTAMPQYMRFQAPFIVQASSTALIDVKVDLHAQGVGSPGDPGTTLYLWHVGFGVPTASSYGVGINTGNMYSPTVGGSVASGDRIFRTTPTVTGTMAPSSSLFAGTYAINKVKIAAAPTRDILMRSLAFEVSVSPCIDVDGYQLYGPNGALNAVLQQINNGIVRVTFDDTAPDRLIPAGGSVEYQLVAKNIRGGGVVGGIVTSRLLDDSVYYPDVRLAPVAYWESGAASHNFIWSPNSTTTPVQAAYKNMHADWMNGFAVRGLGQNTARTTLSGSGTFSCGIQMIAPVGGEEMMIYGTPLTIKWIPNETSTSVAAYLEKNTNGQYVTIGKIQEAGRGSIVWQGDIDRYDNPAAPGEYYIRIVDATSGAWDRSDGPITVLPVDYYSADLKIAGVDGPIVGYASTTIASWTSKNVNVCGLSDQYGNSGPKPLLSSPGSMPITIELNDTAVEQRYSLTCTGALGDRGDTVTILPTPYPADLQEELTAYGNMKRFLKRSSHEYAILGDINWAAAEMTMFVSTANYSMRTALSTSSVAYQINNQVVQVGIQLSNELNAGNTANASELYALLQGLLAQLRSALTIAPTQCADGLDNDGDGKIDYPADPGCTGTSDNEEYNVPPVNAAVTGLMLVDAGGDTDLTLLTDNAIIQLGAIGTTQINVRAVTSGSVGKVIFHQNGTFVRTEGTSPYSLAGDTNGNYSAWSYQLNAPYTISATPVDTSGATGTPYAITITLQQQQATTTPTFGNNIATNPGFENQKNGWSGWGTRVKISSSEKYTGAYAMEFVHNTTGTRTLNNGTTYAVVPGSKVLASAYVKTVGAGTTDAYLELEWRNASGSILKRDQVAYTGGATAWTKIEKTLTVPANATKLKIRLKDSATPSVGSVFFDDISVRLAETVTARDGFFSIMFSNILSAVQLVSAKQ